MFNWLDNTELNEAEKLYNFQELFFDLLMNELVKNRRQEDGQLSRVKAWLNTCCSMLKELNREHSKVLVEFKNLVQFPDLYAELYNL